LQAFGIGREASSQRRIEIDVERQLPGFRFVTERTADCVEEVGEEDFLRLDRYGARLDLREI